MKTVIVAVLVLLVISQSEALKCYCGGLWYCPSSVEFCHGFNNVCSTVFLDAESTPRYSKGCMKSNVCRTVTQPGVLSIHCCSTDLCNRY
ncbi:alpha-2-macroglobulin-like protein [Sarotherodon galilaeus]